MPRIKTGNKREKILDAAVELFSSAGYQKTSIEDIAGQAGIATGTVYLYFKNKEEILIGIFNRFISSYDRELSETLEKIDEPRETIATLVSSDLKIIWETPYRSRLFLFELRKSARCLTFIKEKLITRYESYLNFILEKFEISSHMDTRLLAVMLSGILENLLYNWTIEENEPDIAKVEEFTLELFFGGIFNQTHSDRKISGDA